MGTNSTIRIALSFTAVVLAAASVPARGVGQVAGSPAARPPAASAAASELYRFAMVQAAPGRLLDLIDLYRTRVPAIAAGGDEVPFITRHSQGDHWDLLVIYPLGSWSDYYSRERVSRREAAAAASGVSSAEFSRRLYEMVSWHEDLYVQGPPLATLRRHVQDAGLVHFEMMQALPGRRDVLIEERRMENTFNRERGRGETLIFVHDQGAAWDVVTLGVYRNWRQYSESETIPPEVSDAAAKKAGFESSDAVGPYMRTLISTHRDTLGPPVALPAAK